MPLTVLTKADFEPRPAAEAGKRFAGKAALTSEAFDRLSTAARQNAFRIAKVNNARLIQRARDIVHRAIRDGTEFRTVRQQLIELFDTEGLARPALSRLRFTFQQNAMQAYNEGRREMLDEPDIMHAFPYRQYLTVGNGVAGVNGVRPEHAALHGLIFKADDAFWNAHTPPWDWGCRCTFRALTAGQVQRMGEKVRNLGYIRKRIRVPGKKGRGIEANAQFVRGEFDLSAIDKELRKALEGMLNESTG